MEFRIPVDRGVCLDKWDGWSGVKWKCSRVALDDSGLEAASCM